MTSAMTEQIFQVLVERDVRIPTPDPRITLSAVLHRPAAPEAVPALITVLPYRNDAGAGWLSDLPHTWMAARGYACLLVDFMGTGSSDGTRRPPFSDDEAADAVAAIEWAANQPWCNARIGMWGLSYGAILTMRTASKHPELLDAIIPLLGMLDPERDFVHPQGARGNASGVAVWGAQALLNQLLPPLDDFDSAAQRGRWQARMEQDPWILDLFGTSPGDADWRGRVVDATRISTPALCVSGWRDLFCEAQLRAYEQMTGPKRLVAGPWMHNQPWAAPFQATDFLSTAKRWWDRWLRDVNNGIMDELPVTAYVQGAHKPWRGFAGWPPPDLTSHTLTSESRPVDGVPEGLRADEYLLPIDQTVGPLSGLWWSAVQGFGLPLDQRTDDRRAIAYTSDPLPGAITLAGRAEVGLDWECEAPMRVVVKLTHVSPLGDSRLITQGLTTSMIDGHPCRIELDSTLYHVPEGHRLRVVVGDADFPRLWPSARPLSSAPSKLSIRLHSFDLDAAPMADVTLSPNVNAVQAQSSGPDWSITRDCITSAIAVQHGEEVAAVTPNGRHELVVGHRLVASSTPDGRDAETIAACWARLQMASGERMSVDVEAVLGWDQLTVTGRVGEDGSVLFERRWEIQTEPSKPINGREQRL